jgi:hypothetical protein
VNSTVQFSTKYLVFIQTLLPGLPAPEPASGGTFTVDTGWGGAVVDPDLNLHEAILLANSGSGYANASGQWSVTFTGAPGCFTAFQTWFSGVSNVRASSKFATTFCAQGAQQQVKIFIPIVARP